MARPGILGKETRPRNKVGVVFSILIPLLAAILLFVVIQAKLRGQQLPDFVVFIEALGFVVVIMAGTWFLIRGVREHRESEERYRQMAGHIQEIFWMLDAESKRVLEVNEAYETITGRTRRSLLDNPTSYEEIIHPEDRVHVLSKLDEATRTGKFGERFRITLSNGDIRWVVVHGFPMRNAAGKIWRLVGTAQDITEQKHAEDQVIKNLEIAEAARAEADALRKATLALTQDLHMDSVMEALLRSLEELVPYTMARVIVPEGGPHLLALGEREIPERPRASPKYHPGHPLTLIADECPFLKRSWKNKRVSFFLTQAEKKTGKPLTGMRTCVPGSRFRSKHPKNIWDFSRSATRIRTAIQPITSDGRNCCPFLPLRPFRTPVSTQQLTCMHPNSKSA
jgi:PAS domain S-box-containing protein